MGYAEDLTTIRDNLVSELKTETAYWIANGAKPSYTNSVGVQVDWDSYKKNMLDAIKQANEMVIEAGGDGGIYEEIIVAYSG